MVVVEYDFDEQVTEVESEGWIAFHADTKEEARKLAVDWMEDHPRPTREDVLALHQGI